MINCYVIDDEQHSIDILVKYIKQTGFLALQGTSISAMTALKDLGTRNIDLVFLDIHMPEISGLDVLKVIDNRTKVILTTAYAEYAVTSYEFEVVDYLLKPFDYLRFLKAVQKVLKQISTNVQFETAKDRVNNRSYLFVKGEHKGKQIKINHSEIDYIEGIKNYVSFQCGEKRTMVLMNLRDLEKTLPQEQFVRIHNSYIISLAKVFAIDGNFVILHLQDNREVSLPIGITYKASFLQLIKPKQQ